MLNIGFGDTRKPTQIFIGKEGDSLWHTWDSGKQSISPIQSKSLTGYLRGIDCREFTGKFGTSEKLCLTVEADKTYEILCGINTWFARTVLLRLVELDSSDLSKLIAIEPRSNSSSKVIFCELYEWTGKTVRSSYNWEKDKDGVITNYPNCADLAKKVAEKLVTGTLPDTTMPEVLEEDLPESSDLPF